VSNEFIITEFLTKENKNETKFIYLKTSHIDL